MGVGVIELFVSFERRAASPREWSTILGTNASQPSLQFGLTVPLEYKIPFQGHRIPLGLTSQAAWQGGKSSGQCVVLLFSGGNRIHSPALTWATSTPLFGVHTECNTGAARGARHVRQAGAAHLKAADVAAKSTDLGIRRPWFA